MDLEILRRDRQRIIDALRSAGAVFKGDKDSEIKCPFHDDAHPSGGIKANEKGEWRFTCYAGSCGFFGDFIDIESKSTGRHPDDIIKDLAENEKSGNYHQKRKSYSQSNSSYQDINKKREYTLDEIKNFENSSKFKEAGLKFVKFHINKNPDTNNPEYLVARFKNPVTGKKHISQGIMSKTGNGWILNNNLKNRPIYNRRRVRESTEIIVVEGENKVEALHEVGHVGTCSHGGSNAVILTDWSMLAGKKVWLWRDNDEAGIKYINSVYEIIKRLKPKPEIFFIDPNRLMLNNAEDVVDYLNKHNTLSPEDKTLLIQDAKDDADPETTIYDQVDNIIEMTINGTRKNIDFPWEKLSSQSKALFPGMTCLLCGDPGSTKTMFIYTCADFWHSNGVKVSLYELEDDAAYHTYRALAQKIGVSAFTDDKWVRDHAEESRKIKSDNKEWIKAFGDLITDCPEGCVTYDDLLKYIEAEVNKGTEIIIIDPVTAVEKKGKTWEEDLSFILKAKSIVRKTGARLILITHSIKGKTGIEFAGIAGGAAFSRFPQTLLWINRNEGEKTVMTPMGRCQKEVNRLIKIIKARNAKGAGSEVAFDFGSTTLQFNEIGVVMKENKRKKKEEWE